MCVFSPVEQRANVAIHTASLHCAKSLQTPNVAHSKAAACTTRTEQAQQSQHAFQANTSKSITLLNAHTHLCVGSHTKSSALLSTVKPNQASTGVMLVLKLASHQQQQQLKQQQAHLILKLVCWESSTGCLFCSAFVSLRFGFA